MPTSLHSTIYMSYRGVQSGQTIDTFFTLLSVYRENLVGYIVVIETGRRRGIMSKDFGSINDVSVTKFYGGDDRGVMLQLTSPNGYVQLTAAEIIAILPSMENGVKSEINRKIDECDRAIVKNRELKKTIVSDMREVGKMAIAQPVFEMASLLHFGNQKLEGGDE